MEAVCEARIDIGVLRRSSSPELRSRPCLALRETFVDEARFEPSRAVTGARVRIMPMAALGGRSGAGHVAEAAGRAAKSHRAVPGRAKVAFSEALMR